MISCHLGKIHRNGFAKSAKRSFAKNPGRCRRRHCVETRHGNVSHGVKSSRRKAVLPIGGAFTFLRTHALFAWERGSETIDCQLTAYLRRYFNATLKSRGNGAMMTTVSFVAGC